MTILSRYEQKCSPLCFALASFVVVLVPTEWANREMQYYLCFTLSWYHRVAQFIQVSTLYDNLNRSNK